VVKRAFEFGSPLSHFLDPPLISTCLR